jgi:hypothetical protein
MIRRPKRISGRAARDHAQLAAELRARLRDHQNDLATTTERLAAALRRRTKEPAPCP